MAERRPRSEAGGDIDWEAIERSPEFQELVRRRRAFVAARRRSSSSPGTWASSCSRATRRTSWPSRVYEGLTVGYCLALTQFVMVFVLGIWYLRKADREFDPLAEKAIERTPSAAAHAASTHATATPRRQPSRHADARRSRDDRRLRRGQRRGGRRSSRSSSRSRSASPTGRPSARPAPPTSTPPGAASPASRTAWRSPATTCRRRRSSASPA